MSKKGIFRQVYVTIFATLSIFISGMWLGWPSSVVEKFSNHQTDFDVTKNELSWIVSMMDLGNVVSPLLTGYIMDRIGRKLSIVFLGPLFIASWLLVLCVHTHWALYMARFMAGFGKGMSYTVVPVLLGEIAGVNIRGALSSVFCIQLHSGFLVEAIVGPMVSYRTLNLISIVLPVVFLAMVVWIPESPYYLLKKNRQPEAAKCLEWFRGKSDILTEIQQMEINVKKEMENQATFGEVFSNPKDLKAIMIVVVSCVSQRAGGISCILAYSALILPEPSPIMARSHYVTLFGILLVFVNFIGVTLVDKVGRKPLLILSELGMVVVTLLFTVYFFLKEHIDLSQYVWLPYICHVLFSITYSIGSSFIPVVLLSEMFPVNIRSHCSAIASITLASCSFVTNKMYPIVAELYGHQAMFGLFMVVNFFCAIYAYFNVVETKGKSLVEIQDLLENSVGNKNKTKINQNNNI